MANYFNLVLDTLALANPMIEIENGAAYATNQLVDINISTSDTATTGYQMLIWGDIELAWAKENNFTNKDASAADKDNALWLTYANDKQIKLSPGDGKKTIYVEIRDNVYNVSAQVSASIILDTNRPVVSVTSVDVTVISKVNGKDTAAFSFTSNEKFVEYKIKVVEATGAAENTGTVIPQDGGSENMSGIGDFAANVPIPCIIKGVDLENASGGDGTKIIKVFVKDISGQWSV